ncbi:MAG: hypothetical protein KAR13_16180 [Desulfobulbaceae bacterium]|nr:hypothetical protein [Desulfobulbaceae bacterium]MCK5436779.1 hypothetical protein [Desulfobulbaceae bacterium]
MKKTGFIIALLFVLFNLNHAWASEPLSETEKTELFSQAEIFFHQALEMSEISATGKRPPSAVEELLKKSLMRYERLVRGGVKNGKIFYNIGNIYFRLGDIGRAIVNYRRAEMYGPDDPNLKQNLSYALSLRQDRIEEKQKEKLLKTFFFWHYDLSSKVRSILFVVFYAGFWTFAVVILFKRTSTAKWGLGISLTFLLLFLGSLLVERFENSGNISGVLVDREVVARKGDSASYQPSFKEPLHAGVDFRLIESRGRWLHIELMDGRTCWVPAGSAEIVTM